jgi:tRNA-binding EMAP/Myf-like protein|tara:strand:- start:7234 stop:7602 length:369 start_codon:yes stop_codon:yes gene_type:complete
MKIKDKISFSKYIELTKQLDIRVGIIHSAEQIPKSYGIKLTVEFTYVDENGDEINLIKTAFTNLGKTHEPEDLIGIQCPFIMNLEPSTIKGVTSEVMIMVSEHHELGLQVNPSDYTYGGKLM